MGLRFHHVPNGVFDTGGTGTNAVEARTVAEAIIRHAKSHPALSLGVATFSVSQRRAIQDELEVLRRLSPDTEDFFHAHPSEPFFVKNLENVQGDASVRPPTVTQQTVFCGAALCHLNRPVSLENRCIREHGTEPAIFLLCRKQL